MVHLTIRLDDNEHAVYFAGQILKGTIELLLKRPKKFRGLYFIIYGRSKCHWTEVRKEKGSGNNGRVIKRLVHYNGRETYLYQRAYLFGSDGAHPTEVASGTYRYEFACQLPETLPASFEAPYGNIKYSVEAVLVVSWGLDKDFELQFAIIRNDDLNLQPELRLPCKNEEIRRFCCWFCKSDPLIMSTSIPMSGFISGQIIPVTFTFHNRSNIDCRSTKINLNRIIRYSSSTPYYHATNETEKLVEVCGQGVSAGLSSTFVEELRIPQQLLCSNKNTCEVIHISYELKVEAEIDGCNENIEFLFPITIGSVPLIFDESLRNTESYDDDLKITQNDDEFTALLPAIFNGSDSGPTAPMYDQPPTFEDVMKMSNINDKPSN